ncbi:anti-sigma factor family protein [Nocardioides terrisoli]|uniref:anti-sigma factor family protein n=1 Tax=Nocardioides terrisoli TaxID=3388267 RepID=UPI00287B632F|nr:hypothetical protein [Nocardioides marmorisolisilvae]
MRALHLTGHIGSSVSALVDGQLSTQEEERAWAHVLTCAGCRRLVEREGWTKTRLRTLSVVPDRTQAPSALLGSLYDVDAWAEVDRIERASVRRRTAAAVVGVGSLGFAVLGIVAATTPPAGRGEVPGTPSPAMIRSELIGPAVGAGVGTGAGVTEHVAVRRAAR